MFLRKVKSLKAYLIWGKKLRQPGKRLAYLMGTPIHDNIGDNAIAIAELEFLKENGYDGVVEMTTADIWEYGKCIGRLLPKNAPLYLQGGGNMGDQYEAEEVLRKKIFSDMQGHPVVIFPQTIHYSDTPKGKTMGQDSISIYNEHPNLTLIAREKKSYEIMKRMYPNANVLLAPDIVLSLTPKLPQEARKGILLCFRDDSEKTIKEQEKVQLIQMVEEYGISVESVDMIAKEMLGPVLRDRVVRDRWNKFSKAKLVITDRLHGMVFAAITGTPCIVFRNYNHKVRGTYEWIKYLPYIRYAESVEEAETYIPELLSMGECKYDNTPLQPYYDRIRNVLK